MESQKKGVLILLIVSITCLQTGTSKSMNNRFPWMKNLEEDFVKEVKNIQNNLKIIETNINNSKPDPTEPTEGTKTPKPETESPKEAIKIQKPDTESPTEGTETPKPDTAAPTEGTTTPKPDTAAPTEGTTTPKPDTAAPTEGTKTPEPDTAAPTEGTTTPKPDTAAPTEGPETPKPDTAAPTEGTKTPEPDTAAPTEGTVTPKPVTESPTEGTTTPKPDTESTTEGTKTPNPTMAAPTDQTDFDIPDSINNSEDLQILIISTTKFFQVVDFDNIKKKDLVLTKTLNKRFEEGKSIFNFSSNFVMDEALNSIEIVVKIIDDKLVDDNEGAQEEGSNIGMILGIVGGSVMGLVLIGIFVHYLAFKSKKRD